METNTLTLTCDMRIETPYTPVQTSDENVFNFLNHIANFEKLMPENISKFEVINEERFLFALKGMPEIVLQKKEAVANQYVLLGAASDKLPFTLKGQIKSSGSSQSEVQLIFEGEFNAMMEMMIKTPITNFVHTLAENLSKIPF